MQFIVMIVMDTKEEYIGVVSAAKLVNLNYRTFVKRDQIYDFDKKIIGNRVLFHKKNLLEFFEKNFSK